MTFFEAVTWTALGLCGVYLVAWVASRAFFHNKVEYNRKILRHLKERDDAEKEG